jgi:hypothetical protein
VAGVEENVLVEFSVRTTYSALGLALTRSRLLKWPAARRRHIRTNPLRNHDDMRAWYGVSELH